MNMRELISILEGRERLSAALWWLQRWVSGSMNDSDWYDTPETDALGVDGAFKMLGKVVGNAKAISSPSIWRSLRLPPAVAKQVVETKLLPPNPASLYQSFSRDKEVAMEFGLDLYKQRGTILLLVSAKPDANRIPFGMADLLASRNREVRDALLAIDNWHHQDEVFVRVDTPLPLLSAKVLRV